MTKLLESRMLFSVDSMNDINIVKFDETTFFDKHYKKLQGSKGIDFLIYERSKNEFFLVEVKNFRGSEHEPKTKERLKLGTSESITYETALKVRDSISCIVGAIRKIQEVDITEFKSILHPESKIKVILLLEAPRERAIDYKRLTDDLKNQLAWLNVKVLVLNKEDLQRHVGWLKIENLPDNQ